MTHDELLAKINKIIAFEAPRPIKENIWEIGGYLSALSLRAVVELHSPFRWNSNNYQLCCIACDDLDDGDVVPAAYPCPTIQAIEKELA